jgi:hypothetical protein
MRSAGLLLLVSLASCGGAIGDGIPACNAWIFLSGTADLTFDCTPKVAKPAQPPPAPAKPASKR